MTPEVLELPDASRCELWRAFIPAHESGALYAALLSEVPFAQRAIRVFGRDVLQPRLVAYVGDPDAHYTYSHTRHEPLPWTPALAQLRAQLNDACAAKFNAVLCNLYRNGQDSMGMHSDAEPELGPMPVIASLSLGASRKFCLRHRRGAQRGRLDLWLADGDLLVMRGETQLHYRHALPKQAAVTEPRINLTWRHVHPLSAS